MHESATGRGMTRRTFLGAGAAVAAAGALGRAAAPARPTGAEGGTLTFGAFADAHYADREPKGTRHYRDSSAKMAEFARAAREAGAAFAVSLGDLVDKGETLQAEAAYLKHIEGVYRQFGGPCHHVIGNHDVATFTKEQFMQGTGMPGPHYAFDAGGLHFVVLDGCYRKDGTPYGAGNFDWKDAAVPPAELKWLADDLGRTRTRSIAFIHQLLDDDKAPHAVANAADVRRVLEASGKVAAVFQGHTHKASHRQIGGIHYVTLAGMVEGPAPGNNAYALVQVSAAGIRVRGFGKQPSVDLG